MRYRRGASGPKALARSSWSRHTAAAVRAGDAAAPPARLRVNDLHTAELARVLAAELGAATIINVSQDRNALDLNRTSQVLARAPWFMELLVTRIAAILRRHRSAEIICVHGWNVGQPRCDIGIGARETPSGLQVRAGAGLSVSDAYLHGRVEALRRACRGAGIRVSIGERYPGSHPDNLLQVFARRDAFAEAPSPQIARWAAAGVVDAMQLELGLPLRWPGPWRARFVAAMGEAFAAPARTDAPAAQRAASRRPESSLRPPSRPGVAADRGTAGPTLQLYDPDADLGLLAGVGRIGPSRAGGRLLLFAGGQRVALFTGEERGPSGTAIPPLHFVREEGVMRLRYDGPMLLLDDGASYVDLESALAASTLTDVGVDLTFRHESRPTEGSPALGAATGRIAIGDRTAHITTGGFANVGALRAAEPHRQTTLAAHFGTDEAVLSHVSAARSASLGLHCTGGSTRLLAGLRIAVETGTDPYTPTAFEIHSDGHAPLHGRPLNRMVVLRPAARGVHLRVTFGVARFHWAGRTGYGLYEHARPIGDIEP